MPRLSADIHRLHGEIKFGEIFQWKYGRTDEVNEARDGESDVERDQERDKKIKRGLMILTFISNVIILVLSIGRLLFPGITICQSENVFFTSLTEKDVCIFFLVISVVGIVAVCLHLTPGQSFVILSRVYLAVLLVATCILFGFVIMGYVVTRGDDGEAISGKAYKEYRLQSYSPTLQSSISNRWNSTRRCLVDHTICKSFIDTGINVTQFNATRLSPIQAGCCKPCNDCGFIFITPTNWMKPENANMTNSDCGTWSNDAKELCYECDACKAGMLQNLKDSWKKQGITYSGCAVFIILVFIAGYFALPWKEDIKDTSLEARFIAAFLPALKCGWCP